MRAGKLTPEMETRKWKPGESGNPAGRPKKRPISERYEARAEMPLDEELRAVLKLPKGATYGDALAFAQFRSAIKGKADAAREIREAVEGRTAQRLELTGAEGGPIQHEAVDLSGLSDEELDQLDELLKKANKNSRQG